MSWLALLGAAALAWAPKPAPDVYVTPNYALTFRTPVGATYCPLPRDWVGSDHGTALFLVRPRQCGGGAGYASGARSFPPETPRIEVYYGYWDPEGVGGTRCQQPVETTAFMGGKAPLCRRDSGGLTTVSLQAIYTADTMAQVVLTLVTTPERLEGDLKTLRELAASTRACRVTDKRTNYSFGTGAPCPPGKWF